MGAHLLDDRRGSCAILDEQGGIKRGDPMCQLSLRKTHALVFIDWTFLGVRLAHWTL